MTYQQTSRASDAVLARKPDTLARAAAAACCRDAHWVWMNQFHPEVKAKCATDPIYAATFKQYLPLGGYIATGVWQP